MPSIVGFRELAKLRSLRVLDLSFCEIPVHFDLQTLLAPLTRLRSLQYLSLFGNQVAQGSAKAKHTIISQLPKLQYYDYQLITKEMRDLSLSIATEEQISQQDKRDFINALVAAAPKKNRLLLLEQSTADDEGADGSAALPPALWRHIFQLLPTRDLVALSASCSRFNAICTDIRRSIEVSQLTQITIVHSVHEPSWLLALIASFPAFERYSIRTLRLEHYDEVRSSHAPTHEYRLLTRLSARLLAAGASTARESRFAIAFAPRPRAVAAAIRAGLASVATARIAVPRWPK